MAAPLLLTGDWRVALTGGTVGVLLVTAAAWMVREYDELLGRQAVIGVVVPMGTAAAVVGRGSIAGAGLTVLALAWLAAVVIDVDMPAAALTLRASGLVAAIAVIGDEPTLVASVLLGSSVLWAVHLLATRQPSSVVLGWWSATVAVAALLFDLSAGVVLAGAVAAVGFAVLGWGVDRGSEVAIFGGAFIVWWASLLGLGAAGVVVIEPYLYPVLLFLGWAIHRSRPVGERSGRWMPIVIPMILALPVAFGARVDSGDAGHTVLLGMVGLVLCAGGAMWRHQPALVVGAAATVAVGAYEALDQVVGIESWSWLVVSGMAALTVAAMLELSENRRSLAER